MSTPHCLDGTSKRRGAWGEFSANPGSRAERSERTKIYKASSLSTTLTIALDEVNKAG